MTKKTKECYAEIRSLQTNSYHFIPLFRAKEEKMSGGRELKELVLAGNGTGPKIALISVRGTLVDDAEESNGVGRRNNVTTVDGMGARINRALSDPFIIGVLLKVHSPGGSASASDSIHNHLEKLAKIKPLVSFIPSMGASGAYYISCAAHTIIASPSAWVGSIGVIMEMMNLQGLAEKLGVKPIILTSGKHKGMASPFRDMTPEEERILRTLLDETKARFVDVVKGGRPRLDQTRLSEITSGQIFSSSQALSLGLIDEIGYFPDALKAIKDATGAKNVSVVTYAAKQSPLTNLFKFLPFGVTETALMEGITRLLTRDAGKPLYLWKPTI